MTIKSQLTEKDFINANLVLLAKKPVIWIVLAIAVFYLGITVYNTYQSGTISIYDCILPILLIVIIPTRIFLAARKAFRTNKRAGEAIEYIFEKDTFSIKGETHNSQLNWNTIHKVTQTKNWLYIWQTPHAANPIAKKNLWQGDLNELKEILDSHNIKNNL